MDLGIAGKVALITASSKGLGKASALALAREGCRVMLNARSADDLARTAAEFHADPQVQAAGATVEWCAGDLSDPAEVTHLLEATAAQLGAIDILVANTGGPPAGRFLDHASDATWEAAFNQLVMTPVRLCRGVVPGMAERGWGRLVFITSTSIKQPILDLNLSSVVRPAVAGLAKTLALEYAKAGITSNVVLPGPFDTDRALETLRLASEKTGKSIPILQQERAAKHPMGRSGEPEELGDAVAFLASQRASYINGAVLWVDGGVVTATL
ncbi:MAG: SDR family oxidoreductase [bacterium]